MRRLAFAIGGTAILALSFFGTLYFLDSLNFKSLDLVRIEHAKAIKAALEDYRAASGKYPFAFPNNDLADLRPLLVDRGYISQLPVDPYWKNGKVNKYRYRSSDGESYGLLFYLELRPWQTGVGSAATAPWDGKNILKCPL